MKKQNRIFFKVFITSILLVNITFVCNAQTQTAEFSEITNGTWINTYGNIDIKNNFFWDLQVHFRFQENENIPMVGQWAQIYNRHGLGYIFSKKFNSTVGFVHRLNHNLNQSAINQKNTNSEWRIWHQYQFAIPFSRLVVYHRLRLEHRWSKGFDYNSTYFFRNRYRYMFKTKIPINKKKLEEKAIYVAPEVELIMQSGRRVINSPMEDLRLHLSVGYIVNYKLIIASGLMYTTGQDLSDGSYYRQRLLLRMHVYYMLSFQKWKRENLPFNLLN